MELVLRLLTFNAPYSGYNDPPRFGDFQAHRHWMYLTKSHPIEEWYTWNQSHIYQNETTDQWALDYPPIAAYAHKLYGFTMPDKYSEHGNQDDLLVLRMRLFIFVIDLLLISMIHKFRYFSSSPKVSFVIVLCHPMLILIDYIHYQPNNLMFLFLSASIYLLAKSFKNRNYSLLGTVCFVFCLASKQMAFVYAPVVGMSYLALCIKQHSITGRVLLIMKLTLAVFFAIGICLLPFSINYLDFKSGLIEQTSAIINRIFPIHRGLYEDKLANFWCLSDVIFKWRDRLNESVLAKLCTIVCLASTIPIGVNIYNTVLKVNNPTLVINKIWLACACSSFVGFLFGYHIHEKTILLPVFAILLYFVTSMNSDLNTSSYIIYKFLTISAFNVFPLVTLDSSIHYFIALHLVWMSIYSPSLLKIKFKTVIDVFYSPVIYSLLAVLQAYPVFVITKYPYIFNLAIYAWCFVGNIGCLITLLHCLYRREAYKKDL
eukprot:NODE_653_length_5514_cov_0.694552.p2 type:complete len:487 gc:universal NODE_653_length_5514_cov_0.694552:3967-5427(+)